MFLFFLVDFPLFRCHLGTDTHGKYLVEFFFLKQVAAVGNSLLLLFHQ